MAQPFSATLVRRGLGEIVKNGFEDIVTYHTEFLTVDSSDGQYIEKAFRSDLGPAQRLGDPSSQGLRDELPRLNGEISPVVRKYFSRWGASYEFYDDEADDDMYGVIRGIGTSLGKSMRYSMEVSAHDLLNNGESSSFPQGWQGKALFATDHGLLNSTTTVSNVLASGGPSFASLANLIAYGESFVDDQGMPTPLRPVLILTGMRNQYLWNQVMQSPTQIGQPNSSVINPYSSIRVIGSQYLETPGNSYVFYEGYDRHMFMTVRTPMRNQTWDLKDPNRTVTGVDARWVVYTTNNIRVALIPGAQ